MRFAIWLMFDNCSFTFWLLLVRREKKQRKEKKKRVKKIKGKRKGNSLFFLCIFLTNPAALLTQSLGWPKRLVSNHSGRLRLLSLLCSHPQNSSFTTQKWIQLMQRQTTWSFVDLFVSTILLRLRMVFSRNDAKRLLPSKYLCSRRIMCAMRIIAVPWAHGEIIPPHEANSVQVKYASIKLLSAKHLQRDCFTLPIFGFLLVLFWLSQASLGLWPHRGALS